MPTRDYVMPCGCYCTCASDALLAAIFGQINPAANCECCDHLSDGEATQS